MIYRRKLELDIEELRPELDHLKIACRELRTSPRFKKVLQAVLAIGNALNVSTFRGEARGFQLDALLKLKDTKTTKGGPSCPTLLHYLARLLLRTDASLTTFIEELPNVEAVARLSVDTIIQTADSFQVGLQKIQNEIKQLQQLSDIAPNDRFIAIMEPYVSEQGPKVEALKGMVTSLRKDLQSLLSYFGESSETSEASKYEDFFAMIVAFSSSLQKCALEVHDAEQRQLKAAAKANRAKIGLAGATQTPKLGAGPNLPSADLTSSAAAPGKRSIGRGDVDLVIRSIKATTRKTRKRPAADQPLSKIYMDGGSVTSRHRLID
ncbi:hypothetical protein F5887DRAFT_938683 [Amanita rubescens]|nr:hypothetical protein F5887DRAFT_938683 [Amanita rubescens]